MQPGKVISGLLQLHLRRLRVSDFPLQFSASGRNGAIHALHRQIQFFDFCTVLRSVSLNGLAVLFLLLLCQCPLF